MAWSSAVWWENRVHGIFDTKNNVRGLTSEVRCVWLQPVPRVSVLAPCGLKFAFCDTWVCVGGFSPPPPFVFVFVTSGEEQPRESFYAAGYCSAFKAILSTHCLIWTREARWLENSRNFKSLLKMPKQTTCLRSTGLTEGSPAHAFQAPASPASKSHAGWDPAEDRSCHLLGCWLLYHFPHICTVPKAMCLLRPFKKLITCLLHVCLCVYVCS